MPQQLCRVLQGHSCPFHVLLATGADTTACAAGSGTESGTALHVAISAGRLDYVLDLLEATGVIDALSITDANGDMPLERAAWLCGRSAAKQPDYYDPSSKDSSGIMWEASQLGILQALLDAGAAVSTVPISSHERLRKELGGVPDLFLVNFKRGTEMVRMLAAALVDAHYKDHCGCTTLQPAVFGNGKPRAPLIRLLQDAGLPVDVRDTCGCEHSALSQACKCGDVGCCRVQLEAGASCNEVCCFVGTAVHQACEEGQEEVLRLLLQQPKVNLAATCECYGRQPLHVAAMRGNLTMVDMLVSAGANINACATKSGKSVLVNAVDSGRLHMVKLLDLGATITADGWLGHDALESALAKGDIIIVQALLEDPCSKPSVLDLAATHTCQLGLYDIHALLQLYLHKTVQEAGSDPVASATASVYEDAKLVAGGCDRPAITMALLKGWAGTTAQVDAGHGAAARQVQESTAIQLGAQELVLQTQLACRSSMGL